MEDKHYVVCLGTMGQDRLFTDEEKQYALTLVKAYSNNWSEVESKNL